jgi:hypothetical protein
MASDWPWAQRIIVVSPPLHLLHQQLIVTFPDWSPPSRSLTLVSSITWRRRRVGHDLWAPSQKRRVANTKPVEFWWCRWILLLIFAWSVRRGCGFRIWNRNSIDENRRGQSWGYGSVDPNELNGAASNRWTTICLFHLFDVFDGCGWLRMTNAV